MNICPQTIHNFSCTKPLCSFCGISEKSTDSVLLCVRVPVGEVNLTNRPLCIGRGLAAIKPFDLISEEFFFYRLQAFKFLLVSKATGKTFNAITTDVVKDLLISLPPLSEQYRILNRIKIIFEKLNMIGRVRIQQQYLYTFPDGEKKKILIEY